ncbi:MAG: hypothetical protein WBM32_02845 [Crocosphaera sp.]|jgi:HTH-type transcriptional regulator/antitoxin HigA
MYSQKEYIELLKQFPPRPIKSEEDLEATQKIVNQLLDKPKLTEEESDYLDVLGMLIYDYEKDLEIVPDIDEFELLKLSSQEQQLKHNKKNIMAALRKNTIDKPSEFDHNS